MILGIHCDVRRGYEAALRRAESLGVAAMQLLPYRRAGGGGPHWLRGEPPEEEFAAFRRAASESSVERVVAHVRYLPFLASTDAGRRGRSASHLARETRCAARLGAEKLVLHLGAYSPGSEPAEGMRLFAEGVEGALQLAGTAVPLVVENVPGGGRRMGGTLEELAAFLEELAKRGLSAEVCLDTAHAWAQGYALDSREGMWRFLGRAHRLFGAECVTMFHLNDTRAAAGSHREHHWDWGQGFLGSEGLRELLEREDYAHAIGILETPPGRDEENLAFVRRLELQ